MRDVGNEIAPGFFHPLNFRLIMEHGNRTASGHRRSGNVEHTPRENLGGIRHGHVTLVQRVLHRRQDLGVTQRLHQRRSQTQSAGQQAFHALVGPQHASVRRNRNHSFLHRVQQSFQRLAAVLKSAESVLQLARCLIERRGDVRNFVRRLLLNARRKVTRGDTFGEVGDADQPAADGIRRHHRKEHRDKGRDQRRFQQVTPNVAICLPDR